MRETTMSNGIRLIGRGAGIAALVAMIMGASCGRSESATSQQSKAPEPASAVLKTSNRAAEPESKPAEPTKAAEPKSEPKADGPRLQLGGTEHDFGKIYDTSPQVYNLKVTNIGNMPLTIQKISTSCGCTSANKDEVEGRPIAPGETRSIEITYKPKATASKVTKTVTIQSDDFIEPVQRFKISAQLVEPARLDPIRYQMGQIRSGEGHKTSFYVLSPDPHLEIVSVESDDEYVTFEVVDDSSDDPDFPGRKRIDATISDKIPSGPVKITFTVKTKAAAEDGEKAVETDLIGLILGHVRGELTNNPRFLRIRNAGAGDPFEAKTMLYSENGRAFKVLGTRVVDSTITDVKIDVVPLQPFENDEPGYWITVTGTLPADAKGAFQGKVLVNTDIPNESEKAIIFNGIVRRDTPGRGEN